MGNSHGPSTPERSYFPTISPCPVVTLMNVQRSRPHSVGSSMSVQRSRPDEGVITIENDRSRPIHCQMNIQETGQLVYPGQLVHPGQLVYPERYTSIHHNSEKTCCSTDSFSQLQHCGREEDVTQGISCRSLNTHDHGGNISSQSPSEHPTNAFHFDELTEADRVRHILSQEDECNGNILVNKKDSSLRNKLHEHHDNDDVNCCLDNSYTDFDNSCNQSFSDVKLSMTSSKSSHPMMTYSLQKSCSSAENIVSFPAAMGENLIEIGRHSLYVDAKTGRYFSFVCGSLSEEATSLIDNADEMTIIHPRCDSSSSESSESHSRGTCGSYPMLSISSGESDTRKTFDLRSNRYEETFNISSGEQIVGTERCSRSYGESMTISAWTRQQLDGRADFQGNSTSSETVLKTAHDGTEGCRDHVLTEQHDNRNSERRQMNDPDGRISRGVIMDHFKKNFVAYLCCDEDTLKTFGLPFHRMLESWGLPIFLSVRDAEVGVALYESMAKCVEERCNGKVIVILSKSYNNSEECLFLTYFAKTLDPDSKKQNIIPVMIDKEVDIPSVIRGLSIIKYNYLSKHGWLKKKLVRAIAA